MDLTKINLTGFRNFSSNTEIELPKSSLLVAAAPNAVGKTNFLESIAVLLRGKTWRAKIQECTKWGEDGFLVEGDIERQDSDDSRVAIHYHQPSRKLRIEEDGVPASVVSFYAHYPFILFVPEDTFLLSRGPAQRRNFMNHVLVSHPGYVSSLVQYHRALRQRNIALKKARDFNEIANWTEVLAEHAMAVWRHRDSLVSYWNKRVNTVYSSLSGEERPFNVKLAFGVRDRNNYINELNKAFQFERRFGHTVYGPHRDDVVVTTGKRLVTTVLSRGQLKSLIIAFKVLSHRYIYKITNEEPILLLDDALSELDEKRQVALIKNLPNTQTILTCTALPEALRDKKGVYLLDLRSIIQSSTTKKHYNLGAMKRDEEVEEEALDVPKDEEEVSIKLG
jgi:DNA replication and repair protein RecF